MFREIAENAISDKIENLNYRHRIFLSAFINHEIGSKRKAFSNGLYYIYFINSESDLSIVCSILAVRLEAGLCTFRRVTRVRRNNDTNKLSLRGLHYGIASIKQNRLFMLGADRFDEFAITLLTGSPVVSPNVLYGGIASVSTGSDFKHVPFAITAASSGSSVRDALKKAIVYPAKSPLIDESVSQFLVQVLSVYRAAQSSTVADP
jgi:hypothetical protein